MSVRFCLIWSNNFLMYCSQCRFLKAECYSFMIMLNQVKLLKAFHLIYHDHECITLRRTIRALLLLWLHGEWWDFASGKWHFHHGACMFGIFGDPPWAWLQGSARRCTAGGVSLTIRQQSAVLGVALVFRAFFVVFPCDACLTRSSSKVCKSIWCTSITL